MRHDELLAICDNYSFKDSAEPVKALRAVVELATTETLNWVDVGPEYYEGFHFALRCVLEAIEKELG